MTKEKENFINFINNNNELYIFHKNLFKNGKSMINKTIFVSESERTHRDWLLSTMISMYLAMKYIETKEDEIALEDKDLEAIWDVYRFVKEKGEICHD